MMILKRSKDFYDYLVGIYGVDSKKVFNRINEIKADELYYHSEDFYNSRTRWLRERLNTYNIYIANKMYTVEQIKKGHWEFHLFHKVNTDNLGNPRHKLMSEIEDPRKMNEDWDMFVESDFNRRNAQVVSIQKTYSHNTSLSGLCPILEGFGFGSILSPEVVYSEIDMMLGWHVDNPCKIKQLDDKGKLLANGFDNKISFRHRK